jgi:hypothetical protein
MIVDLGEGAPYYISRREGGVSASGVVLAAQTPITNRRILLRLHDFFFTEMR